MLVFDSLILFDYMTSPPTPKTSFSKHVKVTSVPILFLTIMPSWRTQLTTVQAMPATSNTLNATHNYHF